jgi:hypothetical protein
MNEWRGYGILSRAMKLLTYSSCLVVVLCVTGSIFPAGIGGRYAAREVLGARPGACAPGSDHPAASRLKGWPRRLADAGRGSAIIKMQVLTLALAWARSSIRITPN